METQQQNWSMSDYLREVMTEDGLWRPLCKALVDRALSGDLKAIEFIAKALGEKLGEPELRDFRIMLGPGVEELAE